LILVFSCAVLVALHPLQPRSLLKTIHTCSIDAAVSYANDDAISTLLILWFSQRRTELPDGY